MNNNFWDSIDDGENKLPEHSPQQNQPQENPFQFESNPSFSSDPSQSYDDALIDDSEDATFEELKPSFAATSKQDDLLKDDDADKKKMFKLVGVGAAFLILMFILFSGGESKKNNVATVPTSANSDTQAAQTKTDKTTPTDNKKVPAAGTIEDTKQAKDGNAKKPKEKPSALTALGFPSKKEIAKAKKNLSKVEKALNSLDKQKKTKLSDKTLAQKITSMTGIKVSVEGSKVPQGRVLMKRSEYLKSANLTAFAGKRLMPYMKTVYLKYAPSKKSGGKHYNLPKIKIPKYKPYQPPSSGSGGKKDGKPSSPSGPAKDSDKESNVL